MSELRYPNEAAEYRQVRDRLPEEEKNLLAQTRAVAELRRKLPPGGRLKENWKRAASTSEGAADLCGPWTMFPSHVN